MNSKISTVIAVTVMAALLAACSKEPPKCSDDETIDLVRKIILQQIDEYTANGVIRIGGGEWFSGSKELSKKEIQENLKLELPRATAYADKIKKYSCEAKLVAGGQWELPITYTSQLDDKGKQIVGTGGFVLNDWVRVAQGLIGGVKKGRDASMTPQQKQQAAENAAAQKKIAAQAKEAADAARDMVSSVSYITMVYKESGISGIANGTTNCYNFNLDSHPFTCAHLDLASRRIDQRMSEAQHFPPSEFFADAQFGERIVKVFNKANMNMDQGNDYLRTVTPEINKLVDAELSK